MKVLYESDSFSTGRQCRGLQDRGFGTRKISSALPSWNHEPFENLLRVQGTLQNAVESKPNVLIFKALRTPWCLRWVTGCCLWMSPFLIPLGLTSALK